MDFKQYLTEAEGQVKHYKSCYETHGKGWLFPLEMAMKWLEIVRSDDIQSDALIELNRSLKRNEQLFDIGFHGFCNTIARLHDEMWKIKGENPQNGN